MFYEISLPFTELQKVRSKAQVHAYIKADSEEEALSIFMSRRDEGFISEQEIYLDTEEIFSEALATEDRDYFFDDIKIGPAPEKQEYFSAYN